MSESIDRMSRSQRATLRQNQGCPVDGEPEASPCYLGRAADAAADDQGERGHQCQSAQGVHAVRALPDSRQESYEERPAGGEAALREQRPAGRQALAFGSCLPEAPDATVPSPWARSSTRRDGGTSHKCEARPGETAGPRRQWNRHSCTSALLQPETGSWSWSTYGSIPRQTTLPRVPRSALGTHQCQPRLPSRTWTHSSRHLPRGNGGRSDAAETAMVGDYAARCCRPTCLPGAHPPNGSTT